MSERQPGHYDSVARKWHALAERRRMHVIELRESGRWRHYYTAEGLLEALREAVGMRDAWARIAGLEQQVEASAVDREADDEVHINIAMSVESPTDDPIDVPTDAQIDAPIDAQIDSPTDAQIDPQTDAQVEDEIEDEPLRHAG
jgi:uncharacterized repeat protein (TIGR03809 family)